ncbi:hypothetical protein GA0074695_3879 [Micromonospora viridifaciens]|uniref:Uncharacterized protein n=1 Tax=Micromonospora viridifaciens TaxID=1881 RepID=A0A1C4Y5N8_MICVI|nr:hypothetical protein [Micromonospora viridifaciens]SCF16029.1 hypothetical protein GA0074695_3879 [Micromonospora viridifaciens]
MTSTVTSRQPQPPRKLVYGHAKAHDCLAFADANTASEEAAEITAISPRAPGAKRAGLPPFTPWNPAGDEYDDEEHGDDEPIRINDLGAVSEGDWPEMVTSRSLALLPKDIQARFDKSVATALNGDYLEIPLAAENDIVEALRERGIEVTRDDALINELDGYAFLYG